MKSSFNGRATSRKKAAIIAPKAPTMQPGTLIKVQEFISLCPVTTIYKNTIMVPAFTLRIEPITEKIRILEIRLKQPSSTYLSKKPYRVGFASIACLLWMAQDSQVLKMSSMGENRDLKKYARLALVYSWCTSSPMKLPIPNLFPPTCSLKVYPRSVLTNSGTFLTLRIQYWTIGYTEVRPRKLSRVRMGCRQRLKGS